MRVIARQAHVLENLHRITFRLSRKRWKPSLDGEPCHLQIDSLGAGGIIAWNGADRPVRIANLEGSISRHVGGHRWRILTKIRSSKEQSAVRFALE